MDEKKQTEVILKTLNCIKSLRGSVTEVFTTLNNGITGQDDSKEREKDFLSDLRKKLTAVNDHFRFAAIAKF